MMGMNITNRGTILCSECEHEMYGMPQYWYPMGDIMNAEHAFCGASCSLAFHEKEKQ